jgi:hypothetical protein
MPAGGDARQVGWKYSDNLPDHAGRRSIKAAVVKIRVGLSRPGCGWQYYLKEDE